MLVRHCVPFLHARAFSSTFNLACPLPPILQPVVKLTADITESTSTHVHNRISRITMVTPRANQTPPRYKLKFI